MKYMFLGMLIVPSVFVFAFDVKPVDMTEAGKKIELLPYTFAEDGKKIYKNIETAITLLSNQSIEAMSVMVVYPIDSNKTHDKSPLLEKKEKHNDKNESKVFIDDNTTKEGTLEDINTEDKSITLNKERKKLLPVNLEQ